MASSITDEEVLAEQSLSEDLVSSDLGGLSALQLLAHSYGKKKEGSSSDDDDLSKSCYELRVGNTVKAQMELCVDQEKYSSSLASSLIKRLDIASRHMEKAKESFKNKQWEAVLKHSQEAIEGGIDLNTELYLYRAEAFLEAKLVEEAVSELANAILSLLKKHGFKSLVDGENKVEAHLNNENFEKAIWDITEEKCDVLLKVEEDELQELEDDLYDRVHGLEGAVSLFKKFYEPAIKERSGRIQLLIGKKERFCTEKLAAQSLKKKQEEGSFVEKEVSDEEVPPGE